MEHGSEVWSLIKQSWKRRSSVQSDSTMRLGRVYEVNCSHTYSSITTLAKQYKHYNYSVISLTLKTIQFMSI